MKNDSILILDSGIGGMSVLIDLIKLMPKERYVYFGDNKNAPYGNKTDKELTNIIYKNMSLIKRINPKVIVVACNTLSVDYRNFIEMESGVKCFGVFPPVNNKEKEKTLLLATERTCKKYKENKFLTVLPLKGLAKDIENNAFSLDKINFDSHIVEFSENKLKNKHFDTVILGCTHYFFIKNEIFSHFCPRQIVSGNEISALNCYKYLKIKKSLVNYKRFSISFVGSGRKLNKKFYKKVVKNMIFNDKNFKKTKKIY